MNVPTSTVPGSASTGTSTTGPVVQQPSLEDKILQAASEAEQIAAIFSPAAAQLVTLGVSIEPVVSGLAKLIIGVFHHHTKPAK